MGDLGQRINVWVDSKEYLKICDYKEGKECDGEKLLNDTN
jgi:hypothetical protein